MKVRHTPSRIAFHDTLISLLANHDRRNLRGIGYDYDCFFQGEPRMQVSEEEMIKAGMSINCGSFCMETLHFMLRLSIGADKPLAATVPNWFGSRVFICMSGIGPEWRDYCAHKLIPLNKCRRQNFYLPFRCVDERHEYEKCQYYQYVSAL